MKQLPCDFKVRMKELLGASYDAFLAAYDAPPKRALRVNTQKTDIDELSRLLPYTLSPTGIADEGYLIDGDAEGIGKHPLHAAGLFYVQEPSAMSAAAELSIEPGMRILDMCAAPGGKSGAVAARMKGSGMLVANEYVRSRAKTLVGTLERLGVTNSVVTSAHPDAIAEAMPCFFDAVLVDAPCSGEGMFRKDDTAVSEWSVEHVLTCAKRQLAIVMSAVKALRSGGQLVYSTCTFSREENEGVIEKLLLECPDMELVETKRLYPHTSCGEGHFAAKLIKRESGEKTEKTGKSSAMKLTRLRDKAYDGFIEETFAAPPAGEPYLLKDGLVLLLPFELPQSMQGIYMLSAGIAAGDMKNGRFEPSHALFMAEHGGSYRRRVELPLDSKELSAFLRGETIDAKECGKGYAPVTTEGHSLGFGKITDGVLKNHLPKGLRLLK